MIVQTEKGLGFLYSFSEDYAEVLGYARLAAIDDVMCCSVVCNVHASYLAAVTGALRFDRCLRPEVLIDGTGRML